MKTKRIITLLMIAVFIMSCTPLQGIVSAQVVTNADTLKSSIVACYIGKSNVLEWGTKKYMSTHHTAMPYEADGIKMMPIAYFTESIGGTVSTSGSSVTASYSSKTAVFTNGSSSASVNGSAKTLSHKAEFGGASVLYAPVADLCDIFGVYLHEEDNGLIIYSKTDVSESLDWQNNTLPMKKIIESFLFEDVTGAQIASAIEANYPNHAHPRLVMTQNKFDTIRNELKKGEGSCDPVYWQLYTYLLSHVNEYLNSTPPEYVIESHGRADVTNTTYQNVMLTLAMLYNITDDTMLDNRTAIGQKAYEYMYSAAALPDWHPDSFLDVAEMTYGVALCYDWMYSTPIMTDLRRQAIREGIRNNAIYPYVNHINDPTSYATWDWHNRVEGENFCAVISIVSLGAMAVFDELSGTDRTKAETTLYWSLYDLRKFLSLFAPSGAYPEGNGYWSYALKYYTCTMQALLSAAGSDYGYVDVPGMRTTNYFVEGTTGSRGNFAYHDNYFTPNASFRPVMFLADYFNNNAEMIKTANSIKFGYNEQAASTYVADMFSYNPSKLSGGIVQNPLDNYFPVAETAVMRTGYGKTDTYLGFHCDNPNSFSSGVDGGVDGHSHMDAGEFMLESMGETWFYDLGKDDYSIHTYSDCYRFRDEGHNTVIFNPTSDYSMKVGGKASIVKHEFSENGGYAIGDMSSAYRDNIGVTSFKRGAKLDKRTNVVTIQDEIRLSKSSELYWFAHTKADIEVSADGKTAILSQYGKKLKAIIVSGSGATFSVMDAVPLPTSPAVSGQDPNTGVKKLTIHMASVQNVDLSVVFVGMNSEAYDHPEYFNYVSLANWGATDAKLDAAYNTHFKEKTRSTHLYSVSAPVTAQSGTDYEFISAAYNYEGEMLGLELQTVTPEIYGTETTVSADFDLSNESYISQADYVKFFLWDMDKLEPCMKSVKRSVSVETVEVASGKQTGGASIKGTLGATDSTGTLRANVTDAANLVDGNANTGNGFYANFGTTGNMYIDLGRRYIIDHVDVLTYNISYASRAGDCVIVASNSVTDGAESPDPEKTIVGHILPAEKANTGDSAEYQTFDMPIDSLNKAYRYVSLEKFEENGVGLTVAEVKVYVRESNIPRYVEIAGGKQTGGWEDGKAAYNFSNNFPSSNLVDGNETTDAGFYYNNSSPCKGYTYIDLGQAYKIDHIEIVSYDNVRPRNAGGFDIIATNTLPDQTPYDSENPGTDLLVATLPYNDNQKTADAGRNTVYMPDGSGEYRYISFEQFGQTINGYGLMIQEVKVYVLE